MSASFSNQALDLLGRDRLWQVEVAGLRASESPEQFDLDGWLVRRLPGKAKRARCVNALAAGAQGIDDKLMACSRMYREAGLPLVVRITPFTQPAHLDAQLAQRGWLQNDVSRVLLLPDLRRLASSAPDLPEGLLASRPAAQAYAATVGGFRGSSPGEIAAHVARLEASPVPYQGVVWCDRAGEPWACGQVVVDGDLAGLYDVHTTSSRRGQGLATALCASLLILAREQGARTGYLQVDAGNQAALAVYARLGFVDAYGYHYRLEPGSAT